MVIVNVPRMECRHDVRAVSALLADIEGVVSLEVDVATRTVLIEGDVSAAAVRAAIEAAGYVTGTLP